MSLGNRNHCSKLKNKLEKQFAIRSMEFDVSANWITNEKLICAHTDLAGAHSARSLDLCCGTGQIGRVLKQKGWNVYGLDICSSMAKISSHYFPVSRGKAEEMPFESSRFKLVVCRQAFQFLDLRKVLPEIIRVLKPMGIFILGLTVPFSEKDSNWLYEVHLAKQPLLLKFYTVQDLMEELKGAGFLIKEIKSVVVRESINRWMDHAPELNKMVRKKVCEMIKDAPSEYRKLHRVEIVDGEIFEDWNWVILKAASS